MNEPVQLLMPEQAALRGLAFPECPRWHDQAWWFSDMHDQKVYRINPEGHAVVVLELDDRPAGLAWHGDTMRLVSMTKRRLLDVCDGKITGHVDLSAHAPSHCNDLVQDGSGRVYIGNFGFDFEAHEEPRSTVLLCVDVDGRVRPVANDLLFPNGMLLSDDGQELIVAESYGRCLTSYRVAPDGVLSERNAFARFDKRTPDGICLDATGAIWMASPATREVLRVRRGGEVTHVINTPVHALACMLGGADGRTLMICSAPLARPEKTRAARAGRIDFVRVEVAHGGRP